MMINSFSAKAMRKKAKKSWRQVKKTFINRITEIAKNGHKTAIIVDIHDFQEPQRIIDWLTQLGFQINQSDKNKTIISWEEEN